MIYRKPALIKGKPGAKKLFENSSYFSLKLMYVAAINISGLILFHTLQLSEL